MNATAMDRLRRRNNKLRSDTNRLCGELSAQIGEALRLQKELGTSVKATRSLLSQLQASSSGNGRARNFMSVEASAEVLIDQVGRNARRVALETCLSAIERGDEIEAAHWRLVFASIMETQMPAQLTSAGLQSSHKTER